MSEQAQIRGMAGDVRAFRLATCFMLTSATVMFSLGFLNGIPLDKHLAVRAAMVGVFLVLAVLFARGWIYASAYLEGWKAGKISPQDDPRPIGFRGLLMLKGGRG